MPKSTLQKQGEAICLLCGTVVGDIRDGRFTHHAGCERPIRWQTRLPRCCRCGGSLYFDPSLQTARPSELDHLAVGRWGF